MAFEEINSGDVDIVTYLTKKGVKDLLTNKLNFSYFSLDDSCINYEVSVDDSVKIKAVTGDEFKTFYNGPKDLEFVGDTPAVDTTDDVDISKREVIFIDECNNTESKNIDAVINLGNYFQSLRDTLTNIDTVSSTYEPFIRIFDYVKLNEYVENAFGEYKLWDSRDVNFKYYLSPEDYKKYSILVKTFVNKDNNKSKVIYDNNRFKTPLMLTFQSKRNPNGKVYQNGSITIENYPVNEHLYLVDGTILNPIQLNQGVYDSAKNITPLVRFNGSDYKLNVNTETVFKSNVNKSMFRFNGLLEASIVAVKNMSEFYFEDSVSGEKYMTINMMINTDSVNGVKAKDANIRLTFKINLDETTWNSSNPIITYN
jgi:hypothetical protein